MFLEVLLLGLNWKLVEVASLILRWMMLGRWWAYLLGTCRGERALAVGRF